MRAMSASKELPTYLKEAKRVGRGESERNIESVGWAVSWGSYGGDGSGRNKGNVQWQEGVRGNGRVEVLNKEMNQGENERIRT